MFHALQVLALSLVAVAMALSLAHALELPGKMRLSRDEYVAVQRIYYPGFTIGGGVGEAGGLIATLALLLFTPRGTAEFWLTLVAVGALIGVQAVYWLVTHPVNRRWLEGQQLGDLGSGFFSADPLKRQKGSNQGTPPDWIGLRDRWERSHLARAVLAGLSFFALTVALAIS